MVQLGIDRLLKDKTLLARLSGRRLALLAHPASVTQDLSHSLDALQALGSLKLTAAFGPQHGMRGEKQDNMIESADYEDPVHHIPVFSLYGEVRRPTARMMEPFDVMLVDLQDVGCRIYTFLTTLFYLIEECARTRKEIWILDRPNPAGRPVEGQNLNMNFKSFVGAAPLPMRHGLTLGEAALWYRDKQKLDVVVEVVAMKNYDPTKGPGFGWPETDLVWVNPSPNMPRLSTARQYAGTVLLEGTHLSEGRGTTRPLEIFGAVGIESEKVLERLRKKFPHWLEGCAVRPAFFEPTFHKFKGQLVSALQIHVDPAVYDHAHFRPFRLICAYLKCVHELYPDFDLWLKPPYEYEREKMPIDILSGDERLRAWVADKQADGGDWDKILRADETDWLAARKPFLLYP